MTDENVWWGQISSWILFDGCSVKYREVCGQGRILWYQSETLTGQHVITGPCWPDILANCISQRFQGALVHGTCLPAAPLELLTNLRVGMLYYWAAPSCTECVRFFFFFNQTFFQALHCLICQKNPYTWIELYRVQSQNNLMYFCGNHNQICKNQYKECLLSELAQ